MTELKVYYPTGLIAQVSYNPSLHFDLVQPLDNPGSLFPGGFGAYPVQGLTDRGTIDTLILAGAQGSNRSVVFLVDKWPHPTQFVGITLDELNRPFAYLSVDGLGTVLGEGLPTGPAILQGQQLKLRLSYDLNSPVHGSWSAFLQVWGIGQESWAIIPGLLPGVFRPAFLVVGYQSVTNYLQFNGSINWAQVCANPELLPETVQEEEVSSENGVLDQSLDFPL
jgi:hypothetical protein